MILRDPPLGVDGKVKMQDGEAQRDSIDGRVLALHATDRGSIPSTYGLQICQE